MLEYVRIECIVLNDDHCLPLGDVKAVGNMKIDES